MRERRKSEPQPEKLASLAAGGHGHYKNAVPHPFSRICLSLQDGWQQKRSVVSVILKEVGRVEVEKLRQRNHGLELLHADRRK